MPKEKLIEVKSIYIGSAAKFGLLYGFMWGIIAGFIYLILFSIFGNDIFLSTGQVWLDFITVIGSSVIVVFLLIVVGSALYNLVYPLGGHLHIGLSEFEEPEPGATALTPDDKVKEAQKIKEEPDNAKKKKIYNRTDHQKIAGSRCNAEPGEISRRDRQGVRDQQTNLLPLAQRVWGVEHDPGQETQSTRKRERPVENPGSRSVFG